MLGRYYRKYIEPEWRQYQWNFLAGIRNLLEINSRTNGTRFREWAKSLKKMDSDTVQQVG